MNDSAACSHPLHVSGTDHTAVPDAVAVFNCPGKHVCDRFNPPVGMPGKAGKIVLWNIVPEVVQQQKRVEVFCVPKAKSAPKMHPRTFKCRFRFDEPLNGSNRHEELQFCP